MKKAYGIGLFLAGLVVGIVLFYSLDHFAENPRPASLPEASRFSSLSEFEEAELNGKEYRQLALPNCICYAAYDTSFSSLYLYMLEEQEDGCYTIAVLAGGIGFTIDKGERVATEFMFTPLQMDMIFSPDPIEPHDGYREIAFSNAYLYTSEEYSVVYPIGGYKQSE